MLKLIQCFISHATTAETEMKLFQPLKESWNYFKIILAALNTLEICTSCNDLLNNFEIILGKFPLL